VRGGGGGKKKTKVVKAHQPHQPPPFSPDLIPRGSKRGRAGMVRPRFNDAQLTALRAFARAAGWSLASVEHVAREEFCLRWGISRVRAREQGRRAGREAGPTPSPATPPSRSLPPSPASQTRLTNYFSNHQPRGTAGDPTKRIRDGDAPRVAGGGRDLPEGLIAARHAAATAISDPGGGGGHSSVSGSGSAGPPRADRLPATTAVLPAGGRAGGRAPRRRFAPGQRAPSE